MIFQAHITKTQRKLSVPYSSRIREIAFEKLEVTKWVGEEIESSLITLANNWTGVNWSEWNREKIPLASVRGLTLEERWNHARLTGKRILFCHHAITFLFHLSLSALLARSPNKIRLFSIASRRYRLWDIYLRPRSLSCGPSFLLRWFLSGLIFFSFLAGGWMRFTVHFLFFSYTWPTVKYLSCIRNRKELF